MILALALLSCGKGEDTGGAWSASCPADAGVSGAMTLGGYGASAAYGAAFGWAEGDTAIFYVYPHPDATCEALTAYLERSASDPVDPSDALAVPGQCSLFLKATLEGGGGLWSEENSTISLEGAWWVLDCPLGEGEYTWEDRGADSDYVWSGPDWLGGPLGWCTEVAADGDGWLVSAQMDGFDGNFTDSLEDAPGEGTASVSVRAEPCEGLASIIAYY